MKKNILILILLSYSSLIADIKYTEIKNEKEIFKEHQLLQIKKNKKKIKENKDFIICINKAKNKRNVDKCLFKDGKYVK